MNIYTYTRKIFTDLEGEDAQYNNWAYNINNPMHLDDEGAPIYLLQDIINSDLNINPVDLQVSCDNEICNIFIDGEPLTEEQKLTLDDIVQTHKNYRGQQ